MARMWMDPTSGRELRVYSSKEIRNQVKFKTLAALGIDVRNLHCICCGLHLTDVSRITISSSGAIGPECSKPGHVMPCRHHVAPLVWPYDEK